MSTCIDYRLQSDLCAAPVVHQSSDPLSVRDALALLSDSDVPASSQAAIRSVVLSTTRHLARREGLALSEEELLDFDIRPYLSVLHAAARDVAKARGHGRPAENTSRAAQFVQILTGTRPTSARFREPCPPEFNPLLMHTNAKRANGAFGYLGRLCRHIAHFDAPRAFPSFDQLLEAAEDLADLETVAEREEVPRKRTRSRLLDALSMYRAARERLCEATPADERDEVEAAFAAVPTYLNAYHACHIGTEPKIRELLRARGLIPENMTPSEVLTEIAPELAADLAAWQTETRGRLLAPATQDQTCAALPRVAAYLVRAGYSDELMAMQGVDDLYLLTATTTAGAEQINSRAARRAGISPDEKRSHVVSILEAAIVHEATLSIARSPVTTPEAVAETGEYYFTDAIAADMERVWRVVRDVYRPLETSGDTFAERWALIRTRQGHLVQQLAERALPRKIRLSQKDKLLAIRTVTLPQLVCVALPLRRREVRALRKHWQDARLSAAAAGYGDPSEHEAVRRARDAYFDAAVSHTMLCIATDDGLRRQQYMHGRLGFAAHFRPTLEFDKSTGEPTGITRIVTRWESDLNDPAHLKVLVKGGEPQKREDRDIRPGIVDLEILWDIISIWRPEQLVEAGAYDSLQDYSLLEDLRAGRFALFPSARPVPRSHLSRTDVSPLIGRELHTVVRAFLRPEIEAWEDLGPKWRCIWCAHILRLLNATYWGGVRDDYPSAMWLTMDSRRTLEKEYVVLDPYIRDQRGLNPGHWENPNAYDAIMDRLSKQRSMIDPLTIANLPLPPHLSANIKSSAVVVPHKIRIRRARKQA